MRKKGRIERGALLQADGNEAGEGVSKQRERICKLKAFLMIQDVRFIYLYRFTTRLCDEMKFCFIYMLFTKAGILKKYLDNKLLNKLS